MADLTGKRVAVVATDGYEDSELTSPIEALLVNGASVDVIAPKDGTITGKNGHEQTVNRVTSEVSSTEYDALVLPGGTVNSDHIRVDAPAVAFTRDFFAQNKPVAAICHGGWILADADVLQGRTVTSVVNVKTDLQNAGAHWVDEEVVVEGNLVSSRTPDDLPAFNKAVVEAIAGV